MMRIYEDMAGETTARDKSGSTARHSPPVRKAHGLNCLGRGFKNLKPPASPTDIVF
jgi:hypothetical protein